MRLVHVPGADGAEGAVLASTVELADSLASQVRGLTFRDDLPEDFAMVFEFGGTGYRSIHMLFVRVPLDVLWLRDDVVVQTKTLSPWTGAGVAHADRVVELPGGGADGVSVGDTVRLES
jgi:uncharacterized membrane protein (UPF0127 family)